MLNFPSILKQLNALHPTSEADFLAALRWVLRSYREGFHVPPEPGNEEHAMATALIMSISCDPHAKTQDVMKEVESWLLTRTN